MSSSRSLDAASYLASTGDRAFDRFLVRAFPCVAVVAEGSDLTSLLLSSVGGLADGDVIAIASKVVAKAEGRVVDAATEEDRDRVVSEQTVREVVQRDTPTGRTRIVENLIGVVGASAGVDRSNVEPGRLVLPPEDPDSTARRTRAQVHDLTGRNVGVVITDTLGRPWRLGQTDVAIGCAGLEPLTDLAGEEDPYGNLLQVTVPAVADEIAAAAELAMGKTTGRPFAVVSGLEGLVLPAGQDGPGARAIQMSAERDWFSLGTRDAWIAGYEAAIAGRSKDDAPC